MLIDARLRHDSGWSNARILNLSRRGLMVRTGQAPARGTYVEICRGPHRIVARVVWARHGRLGLRSQDEIAVKSIANGDEPTPLPVPGRERRFRPRPASLAERQDRSRRWSRKLEYLAIAAFALGASLLAFDAVRAALSKPLSAVEVRLVGAG